LLDFDHQLQLNAFSYFRCGSQKNVDFKTHFISTGTQPGGQPGNCPRNFLKHI